MLDKEIVKVKDEKSDNAAVTVKEEPVDTDDDFEFPSKSDEEREVDPVEALAQALDEVEHLCPRCTFRSKEKEKVSQHIVSSHRYVSTYSTNNILVVFAELDRTDLFMF